MPPRFALPRTLFSTSRWPVFLFLLLGFLSAARAQLQHPQLTAVSRASSATVVRGDAISFRFAVTPGTAATQTVTLIFQAASGRALRAVRTTDPAGGGASATIDATWLDDTYRLIAITVVDAWNRTVTYEPDGIVRASNLGDPRTGYYAGPFPHDFDFASLGFTVSGASPTDPAPKLTAVTAVSGATFSPGQTARFRYAGQLNSYALTGLAFVFRSTNGLITYTANVDTTTLNGEFEIPIVSALTNSRYRLSSVIFTDRSGPNFVYTEDSGGTGARVLMSAGGYSLVVDVADFNLTATEFSVTGTNATAPQPRLSDWRRETDADVSPGSTVRFAYATTTSGFPVKSVTIRLAGPFGGSRDFTSESANGTFTLTTATDWLAGPYTVVRVTVTDTVGNVIVHLPAGGTTVGSTVLPIPVAAEAFRFTLGGTALSPYFTLPPPAETGARLNSDVTLQVRAVGLGAVTYQWFRGEPGDTSVPLVNNATTVISSAGDQLIVRVAGPATYWVRATSAGASVNSTAARVVIAAPPVITAQPVSLVVAPGGSATFSVTATGIGPLTYRWVVPGIIEDSIATQRVLRLNNVSLSQRGEVYCEVTNPGGTTRTQSALLTMLTYSATLRLTEDPVDQFEITGTSSASFAAQFTGNPPLAYRWQKDGIDVSGANGVSLDATKNVRLTVDRPTSADEGLYRLIVTNGFETAYSREARLRLTTAPLILRQPSAQIATQLEGFLSISVSAVGAAPLSYQWRKDGVVLPSGTNDSLYLFVSSTNLAGTYDVQIRNSAGSVTSAASVVTVSPQRLVNPEILSGPTDLTARPGDTVTFTVVPSSTEGISCIWSKDSRELQTGSATTFTLRNVGSSDSGRYQVLLSRPGTGGGNSRSFTLTVPPRQNAPVITRPPATATFKRGEIAQLHAAADGRAPLRFQWRYRGVPLPSTDSFAPANEPLLRVPNFDSTKTGAYDVVVTNDDGSVTSAPAVLDLPPPSDKGRLMNVSVRADAGGANGPLIVGFVLGGGTPEPVPLLIRAAGNALNAFGLTGVLANPSATLYAGSSLRFINDDWWNYSPVAATATRVGAFPFPATAGQDAAFAPFVQPGAYTVHVNGADPIGGTVLTEIYDATPATEITDQRPRLLNLSVQTKTTPGNPVIVGFALGGSLPKRVLLRSVGPSLAQFGVTGSLADPLLKLQWGSTVMGENDNWAGDPALREAFGQVGAFQFAANDSKDAALIATLTPGPYTAQVSGSGDSSGIVLVEVYELP